ncbi:MAG: DUF2492 family protein [Armatimonadetes bacterium]|nr:DUF2492 family protein [Armatimonadota bacterium]
MPAIVHGHAILEMLLAAQQPMTRETLAQAADEEFGPDARYHTCSAEEMQMDDLLRFLLDRRKVTEHNGYLTAHREEMCDHG